MTFGLDLFSSYPRNTVYVTVRFSYSKLLDLLVIANIDKICTSGSLWNFVVFCVRILPSHTWL